MGEWLRSTPIWLLGSLLLIACIASAYSGAALTRWLARLRGDGDELSDTQQGYVVSSVFALLALLVAFTFSLAVDRYQTRRALVVQEANAIEAVYLKAQLLDEPHRSSSRTCLSAMRKIILNSRSCVGTIRVPRS